jgi:acyl dehydratase
MTGPTNLAQGTWDEAEALIGTTLATWRGADPVSAADMRRKLEVLGWDCPLHYDDVCARQHGYEGIVSPVSMARVWAMSAYWASGQPRIGGEVVNTPIAAAGVPGEGDVMIATGVSMEYLEPAYAGDRISARAVLRSVTRKTTRVGSGAFLVVETTFSNQRGEVVAVETATVFRYRERAGDE